MNRLWIRLSITQGLVLLAASFLPLIIFGTLFLLQLWDVPLPDDISADEASRIRERILDGLPRQIIGATVASALLGVVAGVMSSRYFAAPLEKLAQAAREIGAQNLDYRVTLDDPTDEMAAVGEAFNEMAAELQDAEERRQRLLSDVAHELRTPLTVVQGNLRAILDDVYPLDKEEVGRLYDQTRHLTRLVNDLHELAQAEAKQLPLNMQPVDVVKLLHDTAADFEPLAQDKKIDLRVELLGNVPTITADLARLTQVLHNLLSNALRYTPENGQVNLQSEVQGDRLQLRVIDSGVGIAADHLPRVFERFYRSDPSRQRSDGQSGTGLGLAITRALVEAHGGRVSVASDGIDRGSTFTIELSV